MFKYKNTTKIKQSNFSAIMLTLCILFSVFNSIYSKVSLDFENFKIKFNKSVGLYKLENYLRQIKMKNFGVITEKNKQNFIFLDNLNFIQNLSDLNLDKTKDSSSSNNPSLLLDEFKARVFSYNFKNFKQGKILSLHEGIYKPVGVNFDEEKVLGWRIYLVLMNSTKNNIHKLLKVCFRENAMDDNFAIVQSFDQSCSDIIKLINEKGILKRDNSEMAKKLHYMQDKLLSQKLRKKIEKSGKGLIKLPTLVENTKKNNSFLETESLSYSKYGSANMNNMKSSATTSFSMGQLAQKFSVQELAKIKSLIKFAKKNKILDEIFNHKGEMTLEDFIRDRGISNSSILSSSLTNSNYKLSPRYFEIQANITNSNSNEISVIKNQIKELKSNLGNQESKSKEISIIKNGIKELNSSLDKHESKISSNLKFLNQNITSIKDMINFTNSLASEFKKSLLEISATLSIFKTQLNQVHNSVERIQNSINFKKSNYIQNKALNTRSPKSNSESYSNFKNPTQKNTKNPAKIPNSPFLVSNEFDFGEDDVLENAKEKNLRTNESTSKNKPNQTQITTNNSEEDDFINP